ncbi:MAG: histidinol dehydrogenase [Acidilobaceae archaeon]
MKAPVELLRVSSKEDVEAFVKLFRSELNIDKYIEIVKPIVYDVKKRGDKALIDYAKKLDKVELDRENIYISKEKLEKARESLRSENKRLLEALEGLAERAKAVEEPLSALSRSRWTIAVDSSVIVIEELKPIDSVACYVPGAVAPYISTAIMCGVAARAAGVKKLVAFAPPASIRKSLLASLAVAGFDGLYALGGAYGVAALAYGTESVEKVSKIAGPGGPYYTAAKILVSRDVGIDLLAGPTELVVYVDKKGVEREIALHLLAQAEHGESSAVALITTDAEIAQKVADAYKEFLRRSSGKKLSTPKLAIAKNKELAFELINLIAPEHLEVCSDSLELADAFENYGVLVEGCVSTAINDYYSGANHILPTSGWARWRGGLSALDFLALRRRVKVLDNGGALKRIAQAVEPLAKEEGFELHLSSIVGELN